MAGAVPTGAAGGRAKRQPKPARSAKHKGAKGAAKAAAGQPALVVVAPEEHAGRRYDLADELTMGRAAGCRITLDDTYVSQLHARVFVRESSFYVEDLGSTNGTYLNRKKVAGPLLLKAGDQVQVGSTVLELVT
jgi:pSer/pThr/pTyr-binding forkhead associated (FHA) protein